MAKSVDQEQLPPGPWPPPDETAKPRVAYDAVVGGSPLPVNFRGYTLEANVWRDDLPDDLVEEAKRIAGSGNPWLKVEGYKPVKKTVPSTAEEYRAYAVAWFNDVKDADAMSERWAVEEQLRTHAGVGTDDIEYLNGLYQSRHDYLKKSAV